MATSGIRGRKKNSYLEGELVEKDDSIAPVTEKNALTPEQLRTVEVFLENDMQFENTADHLGLPVETVVEYINTRAAKKYINSLFLSSGYRNPVKFFSVMDKIIEQKLEDAEDTQIYSNKDLIDILEKYFKMVVELKKLEQDKGPSTAIQANMFGGDAPNYSNLLEKILNPGGDK